MAAGKHRVTRMDILHEMRIGLLQAQLRQRELQANRQHLADMLERHGAVLDLAVLPETFTTGFLGDRDAPEEGMDGPTLDWMSDMAARHRCVITGSAVIQTAAGRRNRLLWVEPDGKVQWYDKRHLFAFGGENERYVAGDERVVFSYRGWRVCPQICYDIRFPVWCRNQDDYDLLLVVANWPGPRIDAWSALLRARAIENQCYVAAVNRTGEDAGGLRYPGQSVLIDPMGCEQLRLDRDEALGTGVAVLAELRAVREKLPFLADADRFRLL